MSWVQQVDAIGRLQAQELNYDPWFADAWMLAITDPWRGAGMPLLIAGFFPSTLYCNSILLSIAVLFFHESRLTGIK